MHNLGTVFSFELVRTLKKPTFWISVLAFPALFAIIGGIMYYSDKTQQDREKTLSSQPFSLVVLDESGMISNQTLATLKASRVDSKQDAVEQVRTGKIDAFFFYPKDLANSQIEVYNKNDGLTDNSKYSTVATQLLKSSALATATSPNSAVAIQGSAKVNQTNFENGEATNPISRMIAPAMFLALFYIVIVLLGNQMLASTTEEKENRVTEMLLTSLSSRTLIVGKILALILLGLIQIAILLLPIILAYTFGREALNIPDVSSFISNIQIELAPMLIGAGLLVSGFMLFTGLLVGIGAATPTAKEANSFFGFVLLLMIVPFYFFPLLMTPTSSVIVTGISYFPLTAPFTLLMRNAFGTVPLNEALIGLTIVTLSGLFAINMAIRIFRYGTLEYSSRVSLKHIFGSKKSTAK